MVDISQLIDKKIDETFVIKAPKSYSAVPSTARKKASNIPVQTVRQKNILTPKLNIKEDRSLLIRAAKTRGESQGQYSSDIATTQVNTTKAQTDPWKAHKRLALLQHPLWIECVKSWWNVMDPHEVNIQETGTDGKITMEQYLDLNVRLQKSLNPDFEYENACVSAAEDWQIDADDWSETVSIGETQHPVTPTSNYAPSIAQNSIKSFNFDKFSEFLFEIGEVWSDGSIESILVIVNCTMLHISQGVHLSSTVFKDIEVLSPLPALLFSEIADMGLNSCPQNMEFMKWYQRNFLEVSIMRKYVCERLFRVIPQEARINDLWINEEGYNQTEVLIQCINRLEGLLNRIKKANPVNLPFKEKQMRPKLHGNLPINESLVKKQVPVLPPIKPRENLPNVSQNVIVYARNVNLTLYGQSFSNRHKSLENSETKQNEPSSIVKEGSKNIKLPIVNLKSANSQKMPTEVSGQASDRGLDYESLFEEYSERRPYSTPLNQTRALKLIRSNSCLNIKNEEARKLFEEGLEPEYTPKLQFNKADVKYHSIDKSWRKGKFLKQQDFSADSPEVGEINKKSPIEYYETKKKKGQEMIKNYEKSRNSKTQDHQRSVRSKVTPSKNEFSDKKDSFGPEEIERLVGIKLSINTPKKDSNYEYTEKVAQTAPAAQSIRTAKVLAEYTFEDFSHLIKPKKPQKLVFKDSLEFLYALNQAKYDFNSANQSEFLHYHKRQNDYRSRRDELGGHISRVEWKSFIDRLEDIIRITKTRRKKRNLRRKKRGKGKKLGFGKGRLWRNVFIKPFNQENLNRNKYLREFKKLDSGKNELPEDLQQIVNETVKISVPPPVHINKPKVRQYSPGRYRRISTN